MTAAIAALGIPCLDQKYEKIKTPLIILKDLECCSVLHYALSAFKPLVHVLAKKNPLCSDTPTIKIH